MKGERGLQWFLCIHLHLETSLIDVLYSSISQKPEETVSMKNCHNLDQDSTETHVSAFLFWIIFLLKNPPEPGSETYNTESHSGQFLVDQNCKVLFHFRKIQDFFAFL